MCRWIAYSGEPIELAKLVISPSHSLLEQGTDTELNFASDGQLLQTNGDGHGVGWYTKGINEPCVYKDKDPIWNDQNLKNVCRHTRSHLFMAHIRLTTTGSVHRENSHPFAYENWVFQHNGEISDFPKLRRALQMDIRPDLFHNLQGTTDSETFFYLALTYGLQTDPIGAIRKLITRLNEAGETFKTEGELNLSCAMSDGETLYTIRYGKNVKANTQFYSRNTECLSDFADNCLSLGTDSVLFVSEPLDSLSVNWTEVPENSFTRAKNGQVEIERLMPS